MLSPPSLRDWNCRTVLKRQAGWRVCFKRKSLWWTDWIQFCVPVNLLWRWNCLSRPFSRFILPAKFPTNNLERLPFAELLQNIHSENRAVTANSVPMTHLQEVWTRLYSWIFNGWVRNMFYNVWIHSCSLNQNQSLLRALTMEESATVWRHWNENVSLRSRLYWLQALEPWLNP